MPKTSRKKTSIKQVVPDHIPCNRIFISAEGRRTEPRYFKKFNKHLGRICFQVVDNPNNESSPDRVLSRLLDFIEDSKNDYDIQNGDSACLVLDVDQHTTLEDTCEVAQRHKIDFYVSNPCFELWLLIHLYEVSQNVMTVDRIKELLDIKYRECNQNGYSKDHYETNILFRHLNTALERARNLDRNRQKVIPANPGTTVYRLIEQMKDELR